MPNGRPMHAGSLEALWVTRPEAVVLGDNKGIVLCEGIGLLVSLGSERDIDPFLVAVFPLCDTEQQLRDISCDPFRVLAAMLELSLVGKRQNRKVAYPPGVRECRVERVRTVMVSILGEQHLTLLLAVIPKGPIVKASREVEVRERHEVEL
jgi:hypothetical protein